MFARFSPFSEIDTAGAGPADKRRPTMRAYIKSSYTRDQLATILMDALDWGPFQLISLTPDTGAEDEQSTEIRYAAVFEIDSGAAEHNSRNHYEWGLMLLRGLDKHFKKDPHCENNSYVVNKGHELARGVIAQGN